MNKQCRFSLLLITCLLSTQIILTSSYSQNLSIPIKEHQTADSNWLELSDKDKYQYLERILLSLLAPEISEVTEKIYKEKRQYEKGEILYIKPIGLSNEIKIEILTFVGAHNPPYGKVNITFLLEKSDVKIINYEHEEIEGKTI